MSTVEITLEEHEDLLVDHHGLRAICRQVGKEIMAEEIACPLGIYGEAYAQRCDMYNQCEDCLLNWAQAKGAAALADITV